jgi:Bifunctional DNA primase/polymerase, N-terminal
MTAQSLAEAAAQYAWLGVPVIPCHWPTRPVLHPRPGCSCRRGGGCDRAGKHPLTPGGVNDATTRLDVVRGWWDRWPHANVGLATGVVFDALDIDGPEGIRAVEALGPTRVSTRVHTPIARTPRGWHYLFAPTGAGNRVRLADGLDWRGSDAGWRKTTSEQTSDDPPRPPSADPRPRRTLR